MDKLISLFVKDEISLDELIVKFQRLLGHDFILQRQDDGLENYITEVLGVMINMFDEHGLEDDLGIDFSSYRYQIDFEILRPFRDNDYVVQIFEAVPRLFYSQLSGVGAMIVNDLQERQEEIKRESTKSMGSQSMGSD